MRLKSLQLEFEWPKEIELKSLCSFIVDKLEEYGSPLRWAITNITYNDESNASRYISIEAVVIIS